MNSKRRFSLMGMALSVRKTLSKASLFVGKVFIKTSRLLYLSPQEKRVIPWFRDDGDRTLRLNYDLDARSVVFDLGGYQGQWASDIFSKYCCEIHVFEPVPEFAENIRRRFARNSRIQVHEFGLGNQRANIELKIASDGSSVFRERGRPVTIQLDDALEFIRQTGISCVDLMKINIEGGEYDLLDYLIDNGFVRNIGNLQIQFHDFVPDAERRMQRIREALSITHRPTYQYDFVWENWQAICWPVRKGPMEAR